MSSLETVVFQRGDVVFAEGDDVEASPYMYILGSGKVCAVQQLRIIRVLSYSFVMNEVTHDYY